MGTGDKGMTVVNATLFPKEFQELQLFNITKDYLPTRSIRAEKLLTVTTIILH
jgi:hypothetical protein